MKKIFVRPRALTKYETAQVTEYSHDILQSGYALVRRPVEEGGAPLKAEGELVEPNGFWGRRMHGGDVVKARPEKEKPEHKEKVS